MARLNMSFMPALQRGAVVPALQALSQAGDIPAEAVIKLSIQSRDDLLEDTPNSSDDLVGGIEIDGFADLVELCQFLQALPVVVNDRLRDLRYTSKTGAQS